MKKKKSGQQDGSVNKKKFLHHKPCGLSLNPGIYVKKLTAVVHICNASTSAGRCCNHPDAYRPVGTQCNSRIKRPVSSKWKEKTFPLKGIL